MIFVKIQSLIGSGSQPSINKIAQESVFAHKFPSLRSYMPFRTPKPGKRSLRAQLHRLMAGELTDKELQQIANRIRVFKSFFEDALMVAVVLVVIYFAVEVIWAFRPGGPVEQIRSVQ